MGNHNGDAGNAGGDLGRTHSVDPVLDAPGLMSCGPDRRASVDVMRHPVGRIPGQSGRELYGRAWDEENNRPKEY